MVADPGLSRTAHEVEANEARGIVPNSTVRIGTKEPGLISLVKPTAEVVDTCDEESVEQEKLNAQLMIS